MGENSLVSHLLKVKARGLVWQYRIDISLHIQLSHNLEERIHSMQKKRKDMAWLVAGIQRPASMLTSPYIWRSRCFSSYYANLKNQSRFHRASDQPQKTSQKYFGLQQLSKNHLKEKLGKCSVLDVLHRTNLSNEEKREKDLKEQEILKKKGRRKQKRWKKWNNKSL